MIISPPIQLATLGMDDTLWLMVLALVVLGPRRLPQIGRQIGKLMYEFRKASNDFKYQLEEELRNAEEADRRKREEAERQQALAVAQTAKTETQTALAQAQAAAEQALQAAAQAQSAAKAAQTAAESHEPAAAESHQPAAAIDAAPAAPPPAPIANPEPSGRGMTYSYGYEEVVATESPAVAQPAAAPVSASGLGLAAEPAPEPVENGLRVQPPLTGKRVPAARPRRAKRAAAVEQPAGPVVTGEEISPKKEVAAQQQPAATESPASHG